jgi:hypothetical protein
MTRHVTDHRHTASDDRLKRFVEIEKRTAEEGSHPAVRDLHARPATRGVASKSKEYARIERGITA